MASSRFAVMFLFAALLFIFCGAFVYYLPSCPFGFFCVVMFEFLVGPARFLYYDRRGPVYFVGWFCFVFRLSSLVFARSRFLFGAVVLILFAIMFSFCVVLRCHVNYLCDFVSFFAWSCVVAPWSRSVFGWPCLVSAWSSFFFGAVAFTFCVNLLA